MIRKERPRGTDGYKCREKKEKGFPGELRAERLSGTAEATALQRGATTSQ